MTLVIAPAADLTDKSVPSPTMLALMLECDVQVGECLFVCCSLLTCVSAALLSEPALSPDGRIDHGNSGPSVLGHCHHRR